MLISSGEEEDVKDVKLGDALRAALDEPAPAARSAIPGPWVARAKTELAVRRHGPRMKLEAERAAVPGGARLDAGCLRCCESAPFHRCQVRQPGA